MARHPAALAAALVAIAVLAAGVPPAAAQQGSVQVSAAAQVVTGDPNRIAGQEQLEPDLGVTWLQPGARFGMFQLEVRATERHDRLHAGRIHAALRDVRYKGLKWTAEAGDAYMSPAIGEYRFSNLFTPTVTFAGASLAGKSTSTSVNLVAGRATAWRNIFGSDPDALDQTLVLGRVSHRLSEPLEISARGSRIRSTDLQEFTHTIAASDQAGGGLRYTLTPEIQLVGDGSVVSYRRRDAPDRELDGSGLLGANWLHARGWVQVNAFRFSPGETPTLNSPLPDREGVFAAGEYDLLSRLRVFAGGELFRTNLDPASMAEGSVVTPRTSGVREFGGVRVQVGNRSSVTLRAEDGDRLSRPIFGGIDSDSDTGSWSAEWQTAIGRFTGSARYARRDNVDRARTEGSYTQQDTAAQVFVGLSRSTQLFGMAIVTRTDQALSRNSYWQAGGGAQVQVFSQNLWMRAETSISRNVDILSSTYVPRESMSLGLNGQLSARTSIGVNVYLDRAPSAGFGGSPWATRSMFRVTRFLPTGATFSANNSLLSAAALERGTGSVRGAVYADWNGNGIQEADEGPLEGIPLLVQATGAAVSQRNGDFAFVNVPAGLREVSLDMSALPVDYDPPSIPKVLVDIERGDTARVSFGLIPLGAIRGRVVRDMNSNGVADGSEPAIDDAVLVLDGGMRSERVRRGRFAFEAVRSGDHAVRLLLESLPEGAVLSGEPEQRVTLARDRLQLDLVFLVSIDKRPEIRRVFPGGSGNRVAPRTPSAAPRRPPATAPSPRAAPPPPGPAAAARAAAAPAPAAAPASVDRPFAIQVAALNDPHRARTMVDDLRARGFSSYLVEPPAADPDAPFKVRVGRYDTRAAAEAAVRLLEKDRPETAWVVREAVRER